MLGLLSYALKQVIIELCPEKSSNHEKHGWNFYSKAVFLQLLLCPIARQNSYLSLLNLEITGFLSSMAPPKRFELPTHGLGNRRSIP